MKVLPQSKKPAMLALFREVNEPTAAFVGWTRAVLETDSPDIDKISELRLLSECLEDVQLERSIK